MRLAGGIVAIIAGVLGLLAAFVQMSFGGVGAALDADGADFVIALSWGGFVFSFIAIALGGCAIGIRSRWPGILLILNGLVGIFLGGTFVAIFMVVTVIAGILALFLGKAPD